MNKSIRYNLEKIAHDFPTLVLHFDDNNNDSVCACCDLLD